MKKPHNAKRSTQRSRNTSLNAVLSIYLLLLSFTDIFHSLKSFTTEAIPVAFADPVSSGFSLAGLEKNDFSIHLSNLHWKPGKHMNTGESQKCASKSLQRVLHYLLNLCKRPLGRQISRIVIGQRTANIWRRTIVKH